MELVKWNGKVFIFSEDLHHIYLKDVEESLKHKREVICAFPKDDQYTMKCFKELDFIVESSLRHIIIKYNKKEQ